MRQDTGYFPLALPSSPYLNLAVYHLEDFLEKTSNPAYGGSFEYGRPMRGHGWHPMNQAELLRMMANHVSKNAPKSSN